MTKEQKQTQTDFLALIKQAEEIKDFQIETIKNDIFVLTDDSHYTMCKNIVDNFKALNDKVVISNTATNKKTLKSFLDNQKYLKHEEIALFDSLKTDIEKQNFLHALNRISSLSRNTTMYKKAIIANKILLSKETYENNNFHFNANIETALHFQLQNIVTTIKDLCNINESFKTKFADILQ